jgi:hypothetical protein
VDYHYLFGSNGSTNLVARNIQLLDSSIINKNSPINLEAETIQARSSTIKNVAAPINLIATNISSSINSSVLSQTGNINLKAENILINTGLINSQDGNTSFDNGGASTGTFVILNAQIGNNSSLSSSSNGNIDILGNSITISNSGLKAIGDIAVRGNQVNLTRLGIENGSGNINLSGGKLTLQEYGITSAGDISLKAQESSIRTGSITADGQITIGSSPNDTIAIANSTIEGDTKDIRFTGDVISVVDTSIKNSDGSIIFDATNRISLTDKAKLTTTGNGAIDLVSQNSISLSNQSELTVRDTGRMLIQGNSILLDDSKITSDGPGDLSLSGQSLDLSGSAIRKMRPNPQGTTANLNLGPFNSITLQQRSTIDAQKSVDLMINTTALTIDFLSSQITYSPPGQLSGSLPANFEPSCTGNSCQIRQVTVVRPDPTPPLPPELAPAPDPLVPESARIRPAPLLPEPVPESARITPAPLVTEPAPVVPNSPAAASELSVVSSLATNDLPADPSESNSRPKSVAVAPFITRDSASQQTLYFRCKSPIARTVLLQQSGRGGLLSTPGAGMTSAVFQDWGGGQIQSQPRSIAPEASPVMEAHDWQVDDRGRVLLLAGQAIEGDRASHYCAPNTDD